jgi:hypothetical protein
LPSICPVARSSSGDVGRCLQHVVPSVAVILSHSFSSMPSAERTLIQAILDTSILTRVTFAALILVDRHNAKSGIDHRC